MTRTHMQSDIELDNPDESFGYCDYCHDVVEKTDNWILRNDILYHEECWKQKHGIVEELNFDK